MCVCVNNLPRVAPSGGTAGNRTRDLSITNPTPYRYTTNFTKPLYKPHLEKITMLPALQYDSEPDLQPSCRNSPTRAADNDRLMTDLTELTKPELTRDMCRLNVRNGGLGAEPPQRKIGKIFFWQISCKIQTFCQFFRQISCRIRALC